ncbi:hypothetical protein QP365_08960 [Corynebacterium aurimucosum]|nr:hypothetical protein [Corynebacterium aurimucosum]NJJ83751.1 hypothetical protein [Corynebacterium aurimucosum]
MTNQSPYSQQSTYPSAPTPGKPKKPLYKRWWFWVSTFLVILVLFAAAIWGILKASEKEDDRAALEECREKIIDHAKYPGGVSFPEEIDIWSNDSIINISRTYRAYGEVDFPNGYGTPVRQYYACTIVVNTGDIEDSTVVVDKSPR